MNPYLYGYSIAAKRYALYEKDGKSDIIVVDPKAHGSLMTYPDQPVLDVPSPVSASLSRWLEEKRYLGGDVLRPRLRAWVETHVAERNLATDLRASI